MALVWIVFVGAGFPQVEGELVRLGGGEVDDEDLVGVTGKDLAREGGAGGFVADRVDGGFEIEFAVVVGGVLGAFEMEHEVAEWLVGFLARQAAGELGDAEEFLGGEGLGGVVLAVEDELAEFGEMLGRGGAGVVVGLAVPEGGFVKLDAFVGDAAEDHGADAAVADGLGVVPLGGGVVEPEFLGDVRCAEGCGQCEGEECDTYRFHMSNGEVPGRWPSTVTGRIFGNLSVAAIDRRGFAPKRRGFAPECKALPQFNSLLPHVISL